MKTSKNLDSVFNKVGLINMILQRTTYTQLDSFQAHMESS